MSDLGPVNADPSPDLSNLWEPYHLRHLTIKNRIVDPAKTLLSTGRTTS